MNHMVTKRIKALLSNYKGVFDSADKIIIGPIFQARDEKDASVTPDLVARTSGHKNAIGVNSFEEIFGIWNFGIWSLQRSGCHGCR